MKTLPDPTREPTVSVERAGALLGISRGSAYEAARRGDIPALRIGKRLVVPTARLLALLGVDAWIDEQPHKGVRQPAHGEATAARE